MLRRCVMAENNDIVIWGGEPLIVAYDADICGLPRLNMHI
jgi:hypothetical protein